MTTPEPDHDGTCAYLQPDDPRAEFEQQCAALNERRDYSALPDIELAMDPAQFVRLDDVSDETCFNERFIEPQWQGAASMVAYMGSGAFNFTAFSVLVLAPAFDPNFDFFMLLALIPAALFAWAFISLVAWSETSRTRYNRQAQVVHIYDGKNLVQLPWREVRPFVMLGDDFRLRLAFPTPYAQMAYSPEKRMRNAYGEGYLASGEFDLYDHGGLFNTLKRLEFIRRYMEHGLESIRPDPEDIKSGLAKKPMARSQIRRNRSGFDKYFMDPIDTLAYWCCAGPLVDRWINHKGAQFRWPEEVERLCAPGADLTGYDTRPVASSTKLYYRWGGMDRPIFFVDRNGNEIPDGSIAPKKKST